MESWVVDWIMKNTRGNGFERKREILLKENVVKRENFLVHFEFKLISLIRN